MKIRNIGSKIINIGATVLMPDAETEVSKEIAEAPAIRAFADMKLIEITEGESEKAAQADAKKAAEEAAKKAEEEAAAKKAAEEAAAKKKAAETAGKNAGQK